MIHQSDLQKIREGRVLVVGDVMLDEYWFSDVTRISPEAPVPIAYIKSQKNRPGGAANVAYNVSKLGSQVTLLSVVGKDSAGELLTQLLQSANITTVLKSDPAFQTTRKIRIMGQQQQLLRLDFEIPPPSQALDHTWAEFQKRVLEHDVVVFSDYQKGALMHVEQMIAFARSHGKMTLVDPKKNDWFAYRQATLITPNRKELKQIIGDWKDETDLQEKVQCLMTSHEWEGLLLTRSEEGMTLFQGNSRYHESTQAKEVFDVSGAGDTVVATLAALLASGYPIPFAIKIANICAGIVVSKLGTSFVSFEELIALLNPPQKSNTPASTTHKIISDAASLLPLIRTEQQQGQKIVMTNGCFDILHPGHIQYLEEARALGDRLVVALNSDRSVQNLKGMSRPINPLASRLRMLCALDCVDWVVPFEEDTPESLIAQVLPDILVKGGDYQVHQIAGATAVLDNGGNVLILPFLDGHSTTKTIEKIKSIDD